jgi:hypothetical protein
VSAADRFDANSSQRGRRSGREERAHPQHTVQDRTSSDTTLEVVDLGSGLVDVERPNDDHPRRRGEVSRRDRDLGADVLVDGVDVVLELSGDRDDGGPLGDSGCKEKTKTVEENEYGQRTRLQNSLNTNRAVLVNH